MTASVTLCACVCARVRTLVQLRAGHWEAGRVKTEQGREGYGGERERERGNEVVCECMCECVYVNI